MCSVRVCVRAGCEAGPRELAGRLAVVMVQPNAAPPPLVSPRPPFPMLATPSQSPAAAVPRPVSLSGALPVAATGGSVSVYLACSRVGGVLPASEGVCGCG